jgi:ATP-dependent Clp protease ATP-binding subunit ClpA
MSQPRLTSRAERTLHGAQQAARRLGHPAVGAEHLLLSLTDDTGVAAAVLRTCGLTPTACAAAVLAVAGQDLAGGQTALELASSAKQALMHALGYVRTLHHRAIDNVHLLLGLTDVVDGLMQCIWIELDLPPVWVRAGALLELQRASRIDAQQLHQAMLAAPRIRQRGEVDGQALRMSLLRTLGDDLARTAQGNGPLGARGAARVQRLNLTDEQYRRVVAWALRTGIGRGRQRATQN